MGKHNLGIFYFKKALQENDHTCAQLGDGGSGQCESPPKGPRLPQLCLRQKMSMCLCNTTCVGDSHRAYDGVAPNADFSLLAKKFAGIPMCALLANKRYELLYNCGIQLLHIGRPLAAFECLMEAVQVYHANPRLWLRLAECCIAANKGVRMSRQNWYRPYLKS